MPPPPTPIRPLPPRVLLACLCLSAPLLADPPDFPSLARRLASDDPAERRAARAELDKLPESAVPDLERFAQTLSDLEARSAFLEAARDLRWRPAREEASRSEALLLNYGEASFQELFFREGEAIRILVAAMEGPMNESRVAAGGRGVRIVRFAGDLSQPAHRWLHTLTGRDFGGSAADWREFAEACPGRSLTAIALEGIEARGYRVLDEDANLAARELLRAHTRESSGREGACISTVEWVVGRMIDPEKPLPRLELDPRALERAAEWVAANDGFIVRQGDAFRSKAARGDYAGRLVAPDRTCRRGCLRALARTPGPFPDAAWGLLDAEPDLVLAILVAARLKVPKERLEAAVQAAQGPAALAWAPETQAPETRELWNADDLAELARSGNTDAAAGAFRLLAWIGEPRHAQAARDALAEYADVAEGARTLCGAAAFALARLGEMADRKLCRRFMSRALGAPDRLSVAIALAGRGDVAGLDALTMAAATEILSPADKERIAKLFDRWESSDEAVKAWGERGVEGWEWQEKAGKWRVGR